ncbi:MAG TPA: ABC transporter ATP-binding protein [Gaiellaceae bacterium]|jgi:ATP-binding cassette subfamily B protein|nr:ABC transporter ATP-binding protein [Gaiellaceae bacterium]
MHNVSAFYRGRLASYLTIVRALPVAGRGIVAVTAALQVVMGLLPVAFIFETSRLIARVPAAIQGGTGSAAWNELQRALLLAAVVFVLQQIVAPILGVLGERMARTIDGTARARLMRASFASDGIGVLEDQEAIAAMRTTSEALQGGFHSPGDACAGLIAPLHRYVTTFALTAVVGVAFSWWAAVALLLSGWLVRIVWRAGTTRFFAVWFAREDVQRRSWYLRDLALGSPAAKELRVFGLTPWISDRYRQTAWEWLSPTWTTRWRVFFYPFLPTTLLATVAIATTLALAGRHAAAAGPADLETLALVLQAATGVMAIAAFFPESDVQTELGMFGWRSLERAEKVIGAPTKRPPVGERADPAGAPRVEIRFEDVSFGYPGGRPVLSGLDLVLPAGHSTAIVGLNGAGKTTLVKLLAGLHEPTSGRMLVDGVDVRRFAPRDWQRRVGAIFQDFLQYELSVRENIGFGAIEQIGDEAAIRTALDRAGVRDLVDELPRGLETLLSRGYEGGAELSGGQWQRIAIARALFAVHGGASVLVLDEPTANLDVRAEVQLFDRFLELTQGLTTILISHRFSTVRRADSIVVLEGGAIVEQGTHEQLLALAGRYARLFERQAARFQATAGSAE